MKTPKTILYFPSRRLSPEFSKPVASNRPDTKQDKKHIEPAHLCRCGYSRHRPFCDGTHEKTDWSPADQTTPLYVSGFKRKDARPSLSPSASNLVSPHPGDVPNPSQKFPDHPSGS